MAAKKGKRKSCSCIHTKRQTCCVKKGRVICKKIKAPKKARRYGKRAKRSSGAGPAIWNPEDPKSWRGETQADARFDPTVNSIDGLRRRKHRKGRKARRHGKR